MSSEEKM